MSPLLFNLYINDLALKITALGKGVRVGDKRIAILLYADDIVLIADSEQDLQSMLDLLDNWSNLMTCVLTVVKSNIVHFRPNPLRGVHILFYVVIQV